MVLNLVILMTVLGAISSGIGGILGSGINNRYVRATLYEITAGFMTGMVCFEMLPESFYIGNLFLGIIGAIVGVALVYFLDIFIQKNNNKNTIKKYKYSPMSLVIIISMAFHNILEGVAIGSGMSYSTDIGIALMISICIHDIPEGIIVGFTGKNSTVSKTKVISNSIFVGMSVGIGVFIGELLGNMSDIYVCISLSLASGAMLYIVACDLIPNSKEISKAKLISIMYILGIILSIIISKI